MLRQNLIGLLLVAGLLASAETAGIPAHGLAVILFDGSNLNQFDTFAIEGHQQ